MPVIKFDLRRELSRLDSYARELGWDAHDFDCVVEMYRSALRDYRKKRFEKYYRGDVEVDGKRVALVELPKEYLPANVLGMTDCFSTIWLRDDLDHVFGYGARERVLKHEKRHITNPEEDEQTVRWRTGTENIGASYRRAA